MQLGNNDMKITLIVTILFLTGCASTRMEVKVIKTDDEATIKTLNINKGDIVLCDKNGCKVISRN